MKVTNVSTSKGTVGFSTIILEDTSEGETVAKLSGNPIVVKKYTHLFGASEDMYEALKVAEKWCRQRLADDHVDMLMIHKALAKVDNPSAL